MKNRKLSSSSVALSKMIFPSQFRVKHLKVSIKREVVNLPERMTNGDVALAGKGGDCQDGSVCRRL